MCDASLLLIHFKLFLYLYNYLTHHTVVIKLELIVLDNMDVA